VREVVSDAYAGEWVTGEFRGQGINHRRSEQSKSELYLEALPLFMRGIVRIPDHKQLLRELRLLERRASRTGRDIIDAPRGIPEDHANALCGALVLAVTRRRALVISPELIQRIRNGPTRAQLRARRMATSEATRRTNAHTSGSTPQHHYLMPQRHILRHKPEFRFERRDQDAQDEP